MKLSKKGKRDASDLQRQPASPVKLTRLLRLLEASVNELPLDANAPAPVTEAHQSFIGAAARAEQKIAQVETAEQAAKQAPAHDADAAAKAMGAEKPAPKPSEAKAAEAVKAALVDTEGAAQLLEKAHDALIDAVQKAWPTWRPQIIRDAAAARVKAAEATAAAAVAVATGRGLFAAVTTLDHQVLSRDANLLQAVSDETRQGLPWYEPTHSGGAPLSRVILPGLDQRAKPQAFDLAVVVDAVAAAVAEAGTWPAADWLPPTDPGHAELLAEPLDPATPWVKARAMRETGGTCSVCQRAPAEVPVVIEGKWWTVCKPCAAANAAEQNAVMDEREREAAARQHGVDPNAFFSIGEDGSHEPA